MDRKMVEDMNYSNDDEMMVEGISTSQDTDDCGELTTFSGDIGQDFQLTKMMTRDMNETTGYLGNNVGLAPGLYAVDVTEKGKASLTC